jgi:hypothetical protein
MVSIVCACPKPGPRFPMAYVVVFFLYSVKLKMIVDFVDIGGIDA